MKKQRTLTTLLVLTTLVLVCTTNHSAQAQQYQEIRYVSFYDEYIERLGANFNIIKNISYRYTFVSEEGNKTCVSFGVFLDYGIMETAVDTDYTAFFFGNRFNNECAQFARNGSITANLQVLGKKDEAFAVAINNAYFNGTDQELLEAFDLFVQHLIQDTTKTDIVISFLPEPTATLTQAPTETATTTPTETAVPPTPTSKPTDTLVPPTPTQRPTSTPEAPAVPAIVIPLDPPDQDQPQAAGAPSLSQEAILEVFALGIILLLGIGVLIIILSPPKKGGGASHA